eukprot:TRINITY_DN25549_c0_g1_i1.p1 TRINITY_DN25549_c0_g1~~TRINITY_DN25549_c0_g1_i1.p1  ORF type:complete len:420 (+),score=76.14 TRINITY_DN25549_c0_g1_i1:37-1296(+)
MACRYHLTNKGSMKVYAALVGVAAAAVHEERLAQLREIQATPGLTWTAAAHPRFASEAPGASKTLCGVKYGWQERIQARIDDGSWQRMQSSELADQEIPEEFDSATHWPQCAKSINDIRDQSNCGCCWAFAGAEAASDRMCIATNASIMLPLSANDVCFCGSDDGCQGGFVDEPWDYIRLHGAVTGSQYEGTGPFGKGMCSNWPFPHCHHHGPQGSDPYPAEGQPGCPSEKSATCPTTCDDVATSEHSDFTKDKYSFQGKSVSATGEKDIQQLIMSGGPVETAFTVYSDFENYAGGVYQHITGDKAGGHAVKIVGWGVDSGVKYWKIANSWNPYWGEQGHFRILRGTNHCGIEDEAVGTSADTKWHQGVVPSTACEDQETEDDCNKLPQGCTWCYIQFFKLGFCKKPGFHCDKTDTLVV